MVNLKKKEYIVLLFMVHNIKKNPSKSHLYALCLTKLTIFYNVYKCCDALHWKIVFSLFMASVLVKYTLNEVTMRLFPCIP